MMEFEQLTKDPEERQAADGPPSRGASSLPAKHGRSRGPWLLAAAAVVLIIVAVTMLTNGDTESPLEVVTDPTPTLDPLVEDSETTDDVDPPAADPVADAEAEAAAEAAAMAADVEVAVNFVEARNNYDANAALALLAPDAGMRDEFYRGRHREYLGYDDISPAEVAAWEQLLGVAMVDADCSASSVGRVRCEYSWENDWSRALGDSQYDESVMLLDMRDGQISYVTNNIESPLSLLPVHTFDVFSHWATFENDSGVTWGDLLGDQNAILRTPEAFALMETLAPVFLEWLNETWTCDMVQAMTGGHPDEPALFCD